MNQASAFVLITFVLNLLSGAARALTADEDVRSIEENGFDYIHFVERCMSVDASGREATNVPLPVGNGWTMECTGYGPIGFLGRPRLEALRLGLVRDRAAAAARSIVSKQCLVQ